MFFENVSYLLVSYVALNRGILFVNNESVICTGFFFFKFPLRYYFIDPMKWWAKNEKFSSHLFFFFRNRKLG